MIYFHTLAKQALLDIGITGLTSDSQIIAYSEGCPRQIVRYQKFVYGFQCHLEFNLELIDLLIENSKEELSFTKRA
ncbi:hypothetical protein NKT34_23040 [Paenibacillus polysaccharolyticus]|uniref:hypothetical protein n=1 Tax=Paenibacillus polysaccharolyticus TaxID=582692 RepID=UPI00209F07FD|nr:hypothetical protein [Paenibacillus polysaccharolyticus]MCP1136178.1 hypothetical protein [Paenibacillus polysaccharolyticus]